jgi:hypothetical protein
MRFASCCPLGTIVLTVVTRQGYLREYRQDSRADSLLGDTHTLPGSSRLASRSAERVALISSTKTRTLSWVSSHRRSPSRRRACLLIRPCNCSTDSTSEATVLYYRPGKHSVTALTVIQDNTRPRERGTRLRTKRNPVLETLRTLAESWERRPLASTGRTPSCAPRACIGYGHQ